MRIALLVPLLASTAYGARLVNRQTANQLLTALNEISNNIPGTCATACDPYQVDFNACPSLTAATIATCACTTQFLTDMQACTACFVTEGQTDGTRLATTITGACAQAGVAVDVTTSSALATSALTSSTSLVAAAATTAVNAGPTVNPATVVLNTASPTSTTPSSTTGVSTSSSKIQYPTVATVLLTDAGNGPFPIQTKNPNVFTGAAASLNPASFKGTIVALSAAAIAAVIFG